MIDLRPSHVAIAAMLLMSGCAASGETSALQSVQTMQTASSENTTPKEGRVERAAVKEERVVGGKTDDASETAMTTQRGGDEKDASFSAQVASSQDGKAHGGAYRPNKPAKLAAASLGPSGLEQASEVDLASAKPVAAPAELAMLEPLEASRNEAFDSAVMGVSASPQMVSRSHDTMPRGGGYRKLGSSYQVKGKIYTPKKDENYSAQGKASWYGDAFHGRMTANGETYDMNHLSAAHPTLPLPSYARVTNLKNGASVVVRINDRGPYSSNRIIDLSKRAASLLGYRKRGVTDVKVDYIGEAPLEGADDQFLTASFQPGVGQHDTGFSVTDTLASLVGNPSDLPLVGSMFPGSGKQAAADRNDRFGRQETADASDADMTPLSFSGPTADRWDRFASILN